MLMKLAVGVRCVVVKSQLENNVFSHIVCCVPYFFYNKMLLYFFKIDCFSFIIN